MLKLAVFDFDSTLMDGETIDFYAKELGIEKKVIQITTKAMNGELDFFESLISRVKLLEGLEYSKIEKISKSLPYTRGAKEIIKELKNRGVKVVCFSGGFKVATSHAKEILGFDADFSNQLHQKDGKLSGLVGGEMMFGNSKGDMLQRLQKVMDITEKETLVCGDGANDLSMFEFAKYKVAFCAKDILKAQANIVIEEKNLMQILQHL